MNLLSAVVAAINAILFLLIAVIPQFSQGDNSVRLLGVWNLIVTFSYFGLAGGLATKQRKAYDAGITLGIANAIFIFLQTNQVNQMNSSGAFILIVLDLIMVATIYLGKQTLPPISEQPPTTIEAIRIPRAVSQNEITDDEGKLLLEIRGAYARDKKGLRDQVIDGVRIDIADRYGVMDQQRWEYYTFVPIATPEIMQTQFIRSRLQLAGSSVHYLIAVDISPDAYSSIPESVGGVYLLRKREKIICIGASTQFERWLARNYGIAFIPVDTTVASATSANFEKREVFKGNARQGFGFGLLFVATGALSIYGLINADLFWVKLVTLVFALLSLFLVILLVAGIYYFSPRTNLIVTESGIEWNGFQNLRPARISADWKEFESIRVLVGLGSNYILDVRKEGKLQRIALQNIENPERIVSIIQRRSNAKVEPFR